MAEIPKKAEPHNHNKPNVNEATCKLLHEQAIKLINISFVIEFNRVLIYS